MSWSIFAFLYLLYSRYNKNCIIYIYIGVIEGYFSIYFLKYFGGIDKKMAYLELLPLMKLPFSFKFITAPFIDTYYFE